MDLKQLTILINIIVRIKAFYINLRSNPKLQRNLVITNAVYIFICLCSKASFAENDLRWFYLKNLFRWIMLTAFIVFLFGKGLTNCIYTYRFGQIGLKNKSGQFPQLLYKKRKNDSLSLSFYSPGLSHDIWEDNILKIENALDITISNITTGKKDSEIIINAYDGKYDWT